MQILQIRMMDALHAEFAESTACKLLMQLCYVNLRPYASLPFVAMWRDRSRDMLRGVLHARASTCDNVARRVALLEARRRAILSPMVTLSLKIIIHRFFFERFIFFIDSFY